MANPRNATTTNAGRFYTWTSADGTVEQFPSVTTLLKDGIPKPALVAWGPKMCAEFVADNLALLNQMAEDKHAREMIVQTVKGSPYRERDAAADIGTLIHEIAESITLGLPLPEYQAKHAGFVRSFRMFLDDWQPTFEASEMSVYNRTHRYAGTLDAIIRVHGTLALIDYKTSRPGRQGHGIYPETALQLNAYANAEFCGMPNGEEVPMPAVDELLAINLRPNGYKVVPVEKSDELYRTFRYVMQVAKFQREGSAAVGEPLPPPSVETNNQIEGALK